MLLLRLQIFEHSAIGFVLHKLPFLIDPFFLQILLDIDLHGINTEINLSKLRERSLGVPIIGRTCADDSKIMDFSGGAVLVKLLQVKKQ